MIIGSIGQCSFFAVLCGERFCQGGHEKPAFCVFGLAAFLLSLGCAPLTVDYTTLTEKTTPEEQQRRIDQVIAAAAQDVTPEKTR